MDERARALDAAHRAADAFLATLPDRPVWPRATLDDMIEVFGGPLPDEGLDAEALVTDLAAKAEPGLVAIPGGRFFGFVIGGTLPAALAADWLVSAWDQNSGSSLVTPTTVALERVAGAVDPGAARAARGRLGRLRDRRAGVELRVPRRRPARDARRGSDGISNQRGARNAPELRLVVGEHRHGSIDRAARFLGIGSDELVAGRGRRRGADAARMPSRRRWPRSSPVTRSSACRRARSTPARSIRSPS